MNQSGHFRRNKRHRLWIDVFASSFLAILFSCFFVFAQASGSANVGVDWQKEDSSGSVAGAHFFVDHGRSVHFPITELPTPPEQETKDGRESNDNTDDDTDKLFASLSLRERLNRSSHKCLLQSLLRSFENRNEISLFVLHHSWKNFLS